MLLIFSIHAIGDEYVGASMNWNMLVWTCEICMKHVCCCRVLVHTRCCCCFHLQLLLLNTSVFIMRVVMGGCYGVFICIRGDGLGDERKLVPHVVESV